MEDGTQQIQVTRDYDQFTLMTANREQLPGHVRTLKKSFEEFGNFTKAQPILVNERMEIIDGQHRFLACKELGQPVYFSVVPGLGVTEARQMNIVHRNWNHDDYAHSYAASGDTNYQKLQELREDFGFSYTTILAYAEGMSRKGALKRFRNGEFVLEDEPGTRQRLSYLADTGLIVPFVSDKNFTLAMLKVMQAPGYDHKRMLKKLKLHQNMLERRATVQDYLRLLENIYNHGMSPANIVYLYR